MHQDGNGHLAGVSRQILCRRRTTVPSRPRSVSASGGDTTASISFAVPATNGGAAITQYRSISTPGSFTNTGTSSPIVVAGLTNGVAYTFTVRATNAVGNGAESTASNSATPSNPSTVPSQPLSVSATAINRNTYGEWWAYIYFSPPASDGGSAVLDYTATVPAQASTTGATSPITLTGLPGPGSYQAYVTARNAVGSSAASANSNAFSPTCVPQTPAAPTAVGGNAQATVTVSLTGSNGGAAYTSCTVTSSPGGFTGTSYAVGGSSVAVVVSGLSNATPYTFTATVANSTGSSAASGASNSVTPAVVSHTVSISPSSSTKLRLSAGVISDSFTATPANGVGPFSYSWAWISGGGGLSIANATTATATVSGNESVTVSRSGVIRCTVTDNGNGGFTAYADASVQFNWETGS